MLDTKGPEIRTGLLEDGKPVSLVAGEILEIGKKFQLILVTDYTFKGNKNKIACSYEKIIESVKIGGKILIADGEIIGEVTEILKVLIQSYQ